MKPIDQVEADLRYNGIFCLYFPSDNRLRFYGFKKSQADVNRVVDALKGRGKEMMNFLIARARAKGENI